METHDNPEILVDQIRELHRETVARWHRESLDNPYRELLAAVCDQHQKNYVLWHKEDAVRDPSIRPEQVAEIKRSIDKHNQERNDRIERVDEHLLKELARRSVQALDFAPINTETPGSAIDRLSVLALRRYHLEEQLEEGNLAEAQVNLARERLRLCGEQQHDLAGALRDLLADIFAGRKRLKVYRQLKMYNDPRPEGPGRKRQG
jgi:hypothetical protein